VPSILWVDQRRTAQPPDPLTTVVPRAVRDRTRGGPVSQTRPPSRSEHDSLQLVRHAAGYLQKARRGSGSTRAARFGCSSRPAVNCSNTTGPSSRRSARIDRALVEPCRRANHFRPPYAAHIAALKLNALQRCQRVVESTDRSKRFVTRQMARASHSGRPLSSARTTRSSNRPLGLW
jgi:hypothetical protein